MPSASNRRERQRSEAGPDSRTMVRPVGTNARRATLPRAAAFWLVAVAWFLLLFAAAAPSPLYRVYQAQWRFSAITLTAVFGVYAFGLLIALLINPCRDRGRIGCCFPHRHRSGRHRLRDGILPGCLPHPDPASRPGSPRWPDRHDLDRILHGVQPPRGDRRRSHYALRLAPDCRGLFRCSCRARRSSCGQFRAPKACQVQSAIGYRCSPAPSKVEVGPRNARPVRNAENHPS